jgi:putative glutamine amidotransferase
MIGIVTMLVERPNGSVLIASPLSYVRAIEAADGIPSLIHLTHDKTALDAHYARCDALLFIGGDDIDPKYYGQQPHPQLGNLEPLRDEVELALARRAHADGKPMLGICRGAQLLNVALGGTLYQDLPAQLQGSSDHRESSIRKDRAYLAHPVALDEGSWLAETLGTTYLEANTLHHQAVRDVAPALRVTGTAPDGVVEAVESTDERFVVGVQCHPEELWHTTEPRWARLFAGFVARARA